MRLTHPLATTWRVINFISNTCLTFSNIWQYVWTVWQLYSKFTFLKITLLHYETSWHQQKIFIFANSATKKRLCPCFLDSSFQIDKYLTLLHLTPSLEPRGGHLFAYSTEILIFSLNTQWKVSCVALARKLTKSSGICVCVTVSSKTLNFQSSLFFGSHLQNELIKFLK